MAEIILEDSEYSYVASTKVITFASPYDALSVGQILKIKNMTTGSVFYDAETQRYPISLSGADVTHTYDDDNDADANKLQITIDDVPALEAIPFNAQAVDGSSDAINILRYSEIGITVIDAVCDGVFTLQDELGATLEFMKDGVIVTSFTGAGSGTNSHHFYLVNSKVKDIICVLSGRTTGSMSAYIRGL